MGTVFLGGGHQYGAFCRGLRHGPKWGGGQRWRCRDPALGLHVVSGGRPVLGE